ncbi:MAG: hypothetical protein LBU32_23090 [Clostridiales bacterium]|nr:hypothetical protein [Clostridiales bacterium]
MKLAIALFSRFLHIDCIQRNRSWIAAYASCVYSLMPMKAASRRPPRQSLRRAAGLLSVSSHSAGFNAVDSRNMILSILSPVACLSVAE